MNCESTTQFRSKFEEERSRHAAEMVKLEEHFENLFTQLEEDLKTLGEKTNEEEDEYKQKTAEMGNAIASTSPGNVTDAFATSAAKAVDEAKGPLDQSELAEKLKSAFGTAEKDCFAKLRT